MTKIQSAHARLITAAPGMLAQLQRLAEMVRGCESCEGTGSARPRDEECADACRECGGVGETLYAHGEIGPIRAALRHATEC